jgi:STE24 endopeptidase
MMKTACLLAALVLLWLGGPVRSAEPAPAAPPAVSAAAAAAPAPVPVPEPTEKALRFHRSGNALWCFRTVWSWMVPALFLVTGFSARLRDWARRAGQKWFFVVVLYLLASLVISSLLNLPLNYYAGFLRQHAYGLSNQSLGKWAGDWLKSLFVLAVIGVAVLWLPYLLLRKSPRRWWLVCSGLAVPLIVLGVVIAPIWIDPLFNHFGPMKDKRLEADILALAQKAGIDGARVFEVNKSADTKALNAYVTGVLGTKRIVLWDTLLARLDAAEAQAVVGHEMGHYVLGHVWWGIALASLFVFGTFWAVHRAGHWLARRFQGLFGFARLDDIASLPLLVLLFRLAWFVALPAANAFSRHWERAADQFGLDITHQNRAAATAFVKMQRGNLGVPRPSLFYTVFRGTHPSTAERIEFCNRYRAGEKSPPPG